MRIAPWCSLIALVMLGCGGSGEGGAPREDADRISGSGGSGGAPLAGAGGQDDPFGLGDGGRGAVFGGGPHDDCSELATAVYVLSTSNEIYRFWPDRKEFTRLFVLDCPTDMRPNSMAIDRHATAWVNYVLSDGRGDVAGKLFKVDTKDGRCEPTSIELDEGWYRLGMGFSGDASNPASERLFVAGVGSGASRGLGRIDPEGTTVTPVGAFSGPLRGLQAELTGTGDGRLFGFFNKTPVELAEIDKATGEVLWSKGLTGVERPHDWAFSFWGGDFYLYTAPAPSDSPSRTTNVTRYRPSDGSIDTAYMIDIGFHIVGAGVSTCAPLAPPR